MDGKSTFDLTKGQILIAKFYADRLFISNLPYYSTNLPMWMLLLPLIKISVC